MTSFERLQQRLQELGHSAKKSLGQNFLVSDNVISKILQRTDSTKAQRLIEIGPGLGALTDGLLQSEKPITLIEMDRRLAEYWRQRGAHVIEADALQIDWLELIGPHVTLVSNLPYQISSSLVIDRSMEINGLGNMILM